jgi:acyl-coenzyme A thioesterase PaaI-like protein
MRQINNPYIGQEGYNCIGCSPQNSIGYQLDFYIDEETKTLFAEWQPHLTYQGYKNVVHGGIQATLLDEIASWVVYTVLGTGGVTSQMHIRYRKPVFITDGPVKIKAWLIKNEKKIADIQTELCNGNDVLCAEGVVQYFVYPENVAREKYGYPGLENFLPE